MYKSQVVIIISLQSKRVQFELKLKQKIDFLFWSYEFIHHMI